MRERSYTHLREQMEAEDAKPLKCHGLDEGAPTLRSACQQLMQKFPAEVAMGVPAAEYLRLVSPAHQAAPRCAASDAQACALTRWLLFGATCFKGWNFQHAAWLLAQ